MLGQGGRLEEGAAPRGGIPPVPRAPVEERVESVVAFVVGYPLAALGILLVPRQGYGSGHNRCYGCYGWLLITPHNTS